MDNFEMFCKVCDGCRVEWISPQPQRRDEPGTPGGWRCLDCGAWVDDPNEILVREAEARWDSERHGNG